MMDDDRKQDISSQLFFHRDPRNMVSALVDKISTWPLRPIWSGSKIPTAALISNELKNVQAFHLSWSLMGLVALMLLS